MTAKWKIAPMPPRREDPHLDTFRSPTPKGHHPHAFPSENELHNPQVMYEYREGFSPVKPLASPRPAPLRSPPPSLQGAHPQEPVKNHNFFSFVAEHPFLTFGFGALVFYGLSKLKEKDAQARINPSYPIIANPSVVLAPGESSTITAEACDRFGRPLPSQPTLFSEEVEVKVKEDVEPEPIVKSQKEKISRPGYKGRRTTQARDSDGKFLPAGTRKRAKTEGKR